MNIITDVLQEENIPYKLKKILIKNVFIDDDEEEDFVITEELYDIHCFTDLKHFDFVKHISDKKISDRIILEKSYLKEFKERGKHVQRIFKKNTSNTDNKNRGK